MLFHTAFSYGSIHAFITYADPKDIIWFDRGQSDCWGITRYPFEDRSIEPCEVKTLTGKVPRAHSAWRVDFEEDGYRAFSETSVRL